MLSEYSVTGVVECSVPTLTAFRIMSECDFKEIKKISEVEDDPAPPLPTKELETLVHGVGQLLTESQLVQSASETPHDPAPKAPSPVTQPHSEWARETEEWVVGKLLELSGEEFLTAGSKEEQQDEGDQQWLLPSIEKDSEEGSFQTVVEQVPHQLEPRDPEIARGARHRESFPASRARVSGRGSRPLLHNTRELGPVSSALLRDWCKPECGVVWLGDKELGRPNKLRLVPEQ